MRAVENRARYDRNRLRCPSDLTDAEWALVAPLIPPAKRGGNKRTVNMRKVVNGLMYWDCAGLLVFPCFAWIMPPSERAVAAGRSRRGRSFAA